ncbi:MAG: DUF4124 domain-containing protein [Polaromonas sp.]|nr:DUF4124 domain-containing protein [Polaromonas sp.]
MSFTKRLAFGGCFAVLICGVFGSPMAQGIYTCVDAKGRKITSDRPITECMDRVQKEISPAGTVKRVLAPPPTAQERAALEEKEKQEAEARSKVAEEKLRGRALLTRYPDRASHDKERAVALEVVNDGINTATKRSDDLTAQRKGIITELEFYKSSPGKAPPALKRRLDETDGNIAAQKRVLADQEAEKKRISQRFDTEVVKLKPQWDLAGASTAAAAPNSAKKP